MRKNKAITMNSYATASLVMVFGARVLAAQSGITVIGSGYINPSTVVIAPGQITTIFLSGVKSTWSLLSPYPTASGLPLPTTLAGFSVTLRQFKNVDPIPVPILSAMPLTGGCPGVDLNVPVSAPCLRVGLTIQVPTGLSLPLPFSTPDGNRLQELVVSENGVPGPAVRFSLIPDNIHVVTNCEPIQSPLDSDCQGYVTHANGTLVQGTNPAQPGETLVLYAFGLGGTAPTVPAGRAAPLPPANLASPLQVAFNFTPGAAPAWPGPSSATLVRDLAAFAGLAPNYAGLYQVNFKVPAPPPGTPACLTSNVQSNVTITLVGDYTYDGAHFCVQTSQAAPTQADQVRLAH